MRSVEAAENLAAISDKEKALVLLFFRNLERAIWLQFAEAVSGTEALAARLALTSCIEFLRATFDGSK